MESLEEDSMMMIEEGGTGAEVEVGTNATIVGSTVTMPESVEVVVEAVLAEGDIQEAGQDLWSRI
jgi:hypothetical protein